MPMHRFAIAAITAGLTTLFSGNALALSNADFATRLADAMTHYRAAVAYLRTGNAALASIELEDMAGKWQPLADQAQADPPPAYAGLPVFALALAQTSARLAAAQSLADEGELTRARAELLPIRDHHYAMRSAVGARVLADCVLEANRLFQPLAEARRTPPNLKDTQSHPPLIAAVKSYDTKLAQCDGEAAPPVQASEQWRRLIDNARASLKELPDAIRQQSEGGLFRYLIELISIDRLLFQRFG